MKCETCKTNVDDRFEYAIKSNQCPACGKNIMSPERLAVFVSLKSLLNSSVKDIDAEKVANLIVANFDLKQKFKELPEEGNTINEEPERVEVGSLEGVEVSEEATDDNDAKEYDEIFKKKQMEEARKKLREDAYNSALRGQYGMESEDEGVFGSDENEDPVARADRLKQEFKRSTSKDKMLTGSGSFSRSE